MARKPVVRRWFLRRFVAVLFLVLSSATTLASPTIEPNGPVKVYLPVVLKHTISGEPDDPGEPDDGDGEAGFEFALDPDGQPVEMIGVQGDDSDDHVRVIVQLADLPLAIFEGNVGGLAATKPIGGRSLDVDSSSVRAYAAYLEDQRTAFRAELESAIGDAVVIHEFDGIVMHGMAILLRRDEIASLERLSGVKSAMIVREHRPFLEFSVPLVGAPEFWDPLGGPDEAGAGQKIAIIDTGIDIDSPFLDDTGFSAPCGFPRGDLSFTNDKVIVARAYFTGAGNPCDPGNPITPMDSHGHGTHIAAIAAGNYGTSASGTMYAETLSGVAPRAFLMSYNVFPCGSDSTSDIDVIAAIEDAVADGATVVNMSLGNPFVGRVEDDLLVQAVENAIAANVVFSIAAGNDGDAAETVGSPGIAPNAITVGASTTEARSGHAIQVTGPAPVPPGLLDILAVEGTGPSLVSDLAAPYTSVEQEFQDPIACSAISDSLCGKIALVRRGGCSFADKIQNVADAGARAAVIYNYPPSEGSLVMDGLDGAVIPSFMVSNWAGLALEDWYRLHPGETVEIEIEASPSWFGRLSDAVAGFSARGPNPNWSIKPDIVAPGVDIPSPTQADPLDSEPPDVDPAGYARLDGTSISAAHVAGAVALVRQRWPWLSVAPIRSALMTTAKIPVWRSDGFDPPLARVMERGSGRIDLGSDFMSKPAFIYPPSHSFGSRNVGNDPVTVQQAFTISKWYLSRTWDLDVVETFGHPNLEVTVSPSTLYVGSSKIFTLQVQANVSVPPGEYEGFVRLTSGSEILHVPYWIRIVNVPIRQGEILLVDDDRNSEDWADPVDCSGDYVSTLNELGYSFTRWDTLENGTPTQADMERASAVIWFTCRDFRNSLNFLAPIEGTEGTELLNYLEADGRLFITGQEIAHGSAPSTVAGLGARLCYYSVFEGGPVPISAVGGARTASAEPIAGGMEFDIATGPTAFVDELQLSGDHAAPILFAHATVARCQSVVGVKNASEPTLDAIQEYPGRSVYLSFDFDDITNDTSFDKRKDLMQNTLNWLVDEVSVVSRCAVDGRTVDCIATLHSSVGAAPAEFRWDLGDGVVLSSGSVPSLVHNYNAPGTYVIRVEATDSWGHKALDDISVTVR